MCILTLVQNDVKSDILKLVLDFINTFVVNDEGGIKLPEIKYGEEIYFQHINKKHKGFFCSLYAIISAYDCFTELFNDDENRIIENEEFIFNLAQDKFQLKNAQLKQFNNLLCERSYLVSNKHCSIADLFYVCAIHKTLKVMTVKELAELYHVFRWYLHIQESLTHCYSTLEKINVRDSLEALLSNIKISGNNKAMYNGDIQKQKEKINDKNIIVNKNQMCEQNKKMNKPNVKEQKGKEQKGKEQKGKEQKAKEQKPKEQVEPPKLDDISRLNILVGYVEHVEVHPDADTLYCLKVNVGEEKVRDICSGLRNKKNAEDLLHKYVLVLANLKEKSLRGRKSHGMVLCGSFDEKVELLIPPNGVKIGERIICENMNLKTIPDKSLSSDKNKNPFFHIQPHLVLKNGIAYYNNDKWLSSQGEITCVLEQGSIS
ncbi:tRNA binding protein, putative [Hepatocystis sp. ex Piliocolobus tephrosceles]|nr:tRNA binding protein, putative [Hepatocystis sp. ex Piliocolobus tephrosceles]